MSEGRHLSTRKTFRLTSTIAQYWEDLKRVRGKKTDQGLFNELVVERALDIKFDKEAEKSLAAAMQELEEWVATMNRMLGR